MSRRSLLRGAGLAVAGAAIGAVGVPEFERWCGWDHPPLGGGYAAAADDQGAIDGSSVRVRYYVETSRPLVALTFDDGPAPDYTPRFLDALEEARVPATFFLVGRNVRDHHELIADRLAGHEVGNHTWSHRDLATMDLPAIQEDLRRTHAVIEERLGRTPTLMRPPYGHLGGSTVLAADSMGYDLVLWNRQMHERNFPHDPAGQARDIVNSVRPGSIVLAHDAGDKRRLIVLDSLAEIVAGLQARGFQFVTVSDLIAAASGPVGPRSAARDPALVSGSAPMQ